MSDSSNTPNTLAAPSSSLSLSPEREAELTRELQRLSDKRAEWASLPIDEKISLLKEVLKGIGEASEGQAEAAMKAKGLPQGSHQRGEEWLGGPMAQARVTRQLIEALDHLPGHHLHPASAGREHAPATVFAHDFRVTLDLFRISQVRP